MGSVRRSKFLHRCIYGAPNERLIAPASYFKGLSERKLEEASLLNPFYDFKHIARTHFTHFSEGLLQYRPITKLDLGHGNLLVKPHLQAFRYLSGVVAVTTATKAKTEGLSQTSPLPASPIVATLRHYGRCYFELSKARLRFACFQNKCRSV